MSGEHIQSAILPMPAATAGAARGNAVATGWLALGVGAAMVLLGIEWLTPPTLSIGMLYMVLAVFCALKLGERQMTVLLTVAVCGGALIKHAQLIAIGMTGWNTIGIESWNGVTRLVTICLFAVVLQRLVLTLRRERQRAERDPLTGVLNRRALIERLPALARQAAADGGAIAVVCIDLDGFKLLNDQHGHAAGDSLLCRFAFRATAALDQTDLFARIGGDEFVAVLTARDGMAAEERAVLLHEKLAGYLQPLDGGLSCSTGVIITAATVALDLLPLIERADRLMYQVKRNGKNALRVAHRLPDRIVGRRGAEDDLDTAMPRAAAA